MTLGFYPCLAIEGIRKNKQLYIPYLLTCICMTAVFYILHFLATNELLSSTHGGETAQIVLALGSIVIFIFSIIFLIYTNSFLIRRRKKEFGLYNILGMSKKNIGKILFWETIFNLGISLAGGLIIGIIFSKVFELILMNTIHGKIIYNLTINWFTFFFTIVLFTFVQGIIYLKSLASISVTKPIELVRSENLGEKKPKANWFLGIAGLIILVFAYFIAVMIKNPLSALLLFFFAVILVIIATYLIMISGSVLLCKILQKNKKYYYNKKHFVSISQMAYRMKRNGAGLASICILMTMVLVTISSTSCLYFGTENAIEKNNPRDYLVQYRYEPENQGKIEEVRNYITNSLNERQIEYRDTIESFDTCIAVSREQDNHMVLEYIDDVGAIENVMYLYFVKVDDFNQKSNQNIVLNDNECLTYALCTDALKDHLWLGEDKYIVKDVLKNEDGIETIGSSLNSVVPGIYIIVNEIPSITNRQGNDIMEHWWYYGLNWDLDGETSMIVDQEMFDDINRTIVPGDWFHTTTKEETRRDYKSSFGSFFYLGCLLSFVFLVSAVLIIYYKQICEGYEDEARFDIMQKVGMKKEDIKKSINSQMLTIFIFPIALAIIHLVFAFPMIQKILMIFGVMNLKLLIITTLFSSLACTLLYIVVYKITSNTYYRIVSH